MTDNEQLIAQARTIHAKAMNCSDFAEEGQWRASEDVIDPPLHNYWRVTAVRAPHQKGVGPYPVTKALTQEPGVAGLLTFVSTALPQLCDLAARALAAEARASALEVQVEGVKGALEPFAKAWREGSIEPVPGEVHYTLTGVRERVWATDFERAEKTLAALQSTALHGEGEKT